MAAPSVRGRKRKKIQRRMPQRTGSRATVEAIFQATARILSREGRAGLNTNRIAELAGVSIGTLYGYFPDKQAILLSMAIGSLLWAYPPQLYDAPAADFDASPLRGPAPLEVFFKDASIVSHSCVSEIKRSRSIMAARSVIDSGRCRFKLSINSVAMVARKAANESDE